MRFAYTGHARLRMEERGISAEMVEHVLTAPASLVEGATADVYTAFLDGVFVGVVLARGMDPRLVITAFRVTR